LNGITTEPQSPVRIDCQSYDSASKMNLTIEHFDGRNSAASSSPVNHRQPFQRGQNAQAHTFHGRFGNAKGPALSSQARSLTNFKYKFGAQLNKTGRDFSPETLTVSDNRHQQLSSMQEVLENLPTEDEDKSAMKEYYDEHDKMQQQIDEVLKGKAKVANLTPNNVTINLRQVLRNLEFTHKQVNQITDTKNNTLDDEDSDDMEEPNFAEMATKIKNAFQQVKQKAVTNMKGVMKNNATAATNTKKPTGKGGKGHGKNKSIKGAEQILISKKDAQTMVSKVFWE